MSRIETVAPNPGTATEITRALTAHQLDTVTGGALGSAVSEVMKAVGNALESLPPEEAEWATSRGRQ